LSSTLGTNTTVVSTTNISTGKFTSDVSQIMCGVWYLGTPVTTTAPLQCQKENVLAEEFGLVEAESITERTKAETIVVGYAIRINGSGWTPSSAYSSLNIDFRHPVEV
jgi:hypothetical protein